MTSPPPSPSQDAILAWLLDPETHGGLPVEHVETHISHLILVGDTVYKMKRNIALAFLDFSTLDLREAACHAEIAVNVRTAPDIYRDVIPITRQENTFALNGSGAPVEWLVRMWRFDDSRLFDRLATCKVLTDMHILGLADAVAELHLSELPVVPKEGNDCFTRSFRNLLKDLRGETVDTVVANAVNLWARRAESTYVGVREILMSRACEGRVRHCHGDLHLRNICEIDGTVRLFDAIEFDKDIATVDVLYDLAFALMDLMHRDLRAETALALSRYLGATRDYEGLRVLPLFMSARAAVRALVALLSPSGRVEALDYLDLATTLLAPAPAPRLVAIGGRSGTGKTTAARILAGRCPGPFGAVMIRSDTTRKRLAGIDPEAKLLAGAYTRAASEAVYDRVFTDARRALDAGACVILDATFLDDAARDGARRVAREAQVPFIGIWLTGDDALLAKRIAGRGRDASDADLTVLRHQREPETLDGWSVLDVGADDFCDRLTLSGPVTGAG